MAVPALFSPATMPDTHAHEKELMVGEFTIEPNKRLLPLPVLNSIVREQDLGLISADKQTCSDAAQFLVGSYPVANTKDPEIFLRSLNMMLDDYPADILRMGMMELIRKNKWLPSIAEVIQCLDRLKFARSAIRSRAQNQLKEHERREKEKTPAITDEQRKRNTAQYEKYAGKE